MITITCPVCGTKVVWDDFQPSDIRCPKCRENLNLHRSLKDNLERREMEATGRKYHCPHCYGLVYRRWFIKCPHCGYWLFGKFNFHGKWYFIVSVIIAYLAFSAYFLIYIR